MLEKKVEEKLLLPLAEGLNAREMHPFYAVPQIGDVYYDISNNEYFSIHQYTRQIPAKPSGIP